MERFIEISIILPTLNEESTIGPTLLALQPLRAAGHEVIVADGDSRDHTVLLSGPWADVVLHAPRGRSVQMNAGARIAHGKVLLFLHADTFLPDRSDQIILDGLEASRKDWGWFDVQLSGKHPLLRIIEFLMNERSRLTGIATGDQAIFVRRTLFEKIGGFPEIDLMEDVALSTMLKKQSPPLPLRQRVRTSSRRWERNGIMRTVFLMWRLRLAYALGADPRQLARRYRAQEER